MGKGGYLGGSSLVGWGAGAFSGRGSVTMQPSAKKGRSPAATRKKIAKVRPIAIPAALAGDEELQRLSKRVKAIEADIKAAQSRISVLNKQLQLATDHLKAGIAAKSPKPSAKARGKQ